MKGFNNHSIPLRIKQPSQFFNYQLQHNMQQLFKNALFCTVMLAFFVLACTQPEAPSAKKDAAAPNAVAGSNPVTQSDSIPRDTARNREAAYTAVKNAIVQQMGGNSTNAKYLVNGFRIPVNDLKGILQAYYDGATPTDSIYGMLAIRNGQTELILQTTDSRTGKLRFFDFTNPCPPYCPKK